MRYARRSGREQEHQAFRDEAQAIERRIAEVAEAPGPIVVGPWLAEVGYEVLYLDPVPALVPGRARRAARAADRRVARRPRRAVPPVAGGYVDLFDVTTPQELAARNAERRAAHEGGGQKQTDAGAFDAS